ncbi:MAG: YraN family protein [Clostridia bacterium]|nr:YraN family protein [Clostridia bacterium]
MAVEKSNAERDAENKKLGKLGEKKARAHLRKNGYKIVKKNYVNPFGEVDIIAEKNGVTAFVEVKTRLSDIFGAPSEAVTRVKQRKYIQAAKYYFTGKEVDCTVRFDIIEVFRGQINHIENAFYENGGY